jgi:regulatory protein
VRGKELSPTLARQRALRRLARRDHSEAELRRALLRLGFAAPVVEATLERLRAEKFLDDQGLATRFTRSHVVHHGAGRNRVRQALRARGLLRGIIEEGVAAALRDVSEAEALETVARRYWRQHGRDAPLPRIRKLWAFLLRRGFPAGLVRERLGTLWPRWREGLVDLPEDETVTTDGAGEAGESEEEP